MYSLIKTYGNVKGFAIKDSRCLVNNSHEILDLHENRILYSSKTDLMEINFRSKFFINNIKGNGIYFNDLLIPIETDYFIHSFNDNFGLYSIRDGETRSTLITELDTNKISKIDYASTINYLFDGYLFMKNFDEKKLEAFSSITSQSLWKYSVSELGGYKPIKKNGEKLYEASRFLGVWKDELLVSCDGGLLFSLDIKTGFVLRKWNKLPHSADEFVTELLEGGLYQLGHIYQLNNVGDRIISFFLQYFLQVNLLTGELTLNAIKEELKRHNIQDFQYKSGYAEDDTHYYTTVRFDKDRLNINYTPTGLCALNKVTLKIDWLYRFDLSGGDDYVSVHVPQVSDGKLYQLTANGNLHIFHRTV